MLKKKYMATRTKNRVVFGVSFGKTPSPNPLRGMGCESLAGVVFGVFISTAGKFYKNDHRGQMNNQGVPAKIVPATEKNLQKPQKPRCGCDVASSSYQRTIDGAPG